MNPEPALSAPVLRAVPAPPAKPVVPLAERHALTLPEAEALGYGSERLLREMIRTGQLKRCVLRVGKRGVRLLQVVLVEELQERS